MSSSGRWRHSPELIERQLLQPTHPPQALAVSVQLNEGQIAPLTSIHGKDVFWSWPERGVAQRQGMRCL
jgi:hypothetical protein